MFPFDPAKRQIYEQYVQAQQSGDHSGIDHEQVLGHVQQFMQQAPPELQHQVYHQYFQEMPLDQRRQFAQQLPPTYQAAMDPNDPRQMAQGFQQMGQQPGLLQKIMGLAGGQSGGAGGMLSSPMARSALTGIAGMAARHLLGGQGGGLGGGGGLLGGLGGGLLGGTQQGFGGGWGEERDERDREDQPGYQQDDGAYQSNDGGGGYQQDDGTYQSNDDGGGYQSDDGGNQGDGGGDS